MDRLVYGVGINDANYVVSKYDSSGSGATRQNKLIWRCPFYMKWVAMLKRCYGKLGDYPSYKTCYVCNEWLIFSNFRAWMNEQDWEGRELDKDVLVKGNKVYSPDTCVFVESRINKFILCEHNSPSDLTMRSDRNNYRVKYYDGKSSKSLRSFDSQEEAYTAWLSYKHDLACKLAETQSDLRVANALRTRYLKEPYDELKN